MWPQNPRMDQPSPPPPPYAPGKIPSLPYPNTLPQNSPMQMISPSFSQQGLTNYQPSPLNSSWGTQQMGSYTGLSTTTANKPPLAPYGYMNTDFQRLQASPYFYGGQTQVTNPSNNFNATSPEDNTLIPPPQDTELTNTIHLVAEHCSKNVDLEAYVRKNNGHEFKFRFLVGGEGSDYFRWALNCFRRGVNPTTINQNDLPESQSALNDEEKELQEVIKTFELPANISPLNESLNKELDDISTTLLHQATPENILNARHWVEVNFSNNEVAKQIPFAIYNKISNISNFPQQLHLLYVVHDVLQNEVVKEDNVELRRYNIHFKPYLAWILRAVYQSGQKLNDQSEEKVSAILDLWRTRNILTVEEHTQIKKLLAAKNIPLSNKADSTKKKRSRFDKGPPTSNDNAIPTSSFISPTQPVVFNTFYPPGMTTIPQFQPQFQPMMGMMQPYPIPNTPLPNPFISPTVPTMVNNFPPPPPLASGFGNRPEAINQSIDNISVGVMASLFKSLSKRGKNMQTAFVPYKPLDPMSASQFLSPLDPPSDYILDRVDNFYQDLKRAEIIPDKKPGKPKSSKRRPTRSSSRSNSSRSKSSSPERRHRTRERTRRPSLDLVRPSAWVQEEMGVGEDGSVLASGTKSEYLGLGAGNMAAETDVFERYRRQRASKYHEHIAHNQASRRDTGSSRRIPDSEKLCYICQQNIPHSGQGLSRISRAKPTSLHSPDDVYIHNTSPSPSNNNIPKRNSLNQGRTSQHRYSPYEDPYNYGYFSRHQEKPKLRLSTSKQRMEDERTRRVQQYRRRSWKSKNDLDNPYDKSPQTYDKYTPQHPNHMQAYQHTSSLHTLHQPSISHPTYHMHHTSIPPHHIYQDSQRPSTQTYHAHQNTHHPITPSRHAQIRTTPNNHTHYQPTSAPIINIPNAPIPPPIEKSLPPIHALLPSLPHFIRNEDIPILNDISTVLHPSQANNFPNVENAKIGVNCTPMDKYKFLYSNQTSKINNKSSSSSTEPVPYIVAPTQTYTQNYSSQSYRNSQEVDNGYNEFHTEQPHAPPPPLADLKITPTPNFSSYQQNPQISITRHLTNNGVEHHIKFPMSNIQLQPSPPSVPPLPNPNESKKHRENSNTSPQSKSIIPTHSMAYSPTNQPDIDGDKTPELPPNLKGNEIFGNRTSSIQDWSSKRHKASFVSEGSPTKHRRISFREPQLHTFHRSADQANTPLNKSNFKIAVPTTSKNLLTNSRRTSVGNHKGANQLATAPTEHKLISSMRKFNYLDGNQRLVNLNNVEIIKGLLDKYKIPHPPGNFQTQTYFKSSKHKPLLIEECSHIIQLAEEFRTYTIKNLMDYPLEGKFNSQRKNMLIKLVSTLFSQVNVSFQKRVIENGGVDEFLTPEINLPPPVHILTDLKLSPTEGIGESLKEALHKALQEKFSDHLKRMSRLLKEWKVIENIASESNLNTDNLSADLDEKLSIAEENVPIPQTTRTEENLKINETTSIESSALTKDFLITLENQKHNFSQEHRSNMRNLQRKVLQGVKNCLLMLDGLHLFKSKIGRFGVLLANRVIFSLDEKKHLLMMQNTLLNERKDDFTPTTNQIQTIHPTWLTRLAPTLPNLGLELDMGKFDDLSRISISSLLSSRSNSSDPNRTQNAKENDKNINCETATNVDNNTNRGPYTSSLKTSSLNYINVYREKFPSLLNPKTSQLKGGETSNISFTLPKQNKNSVDTFKDNTASSIWSIKAIEENEITSKYHDINDISLEDFIVPQPSFKKKFLINS